MESEDRTEAVRGGSVRVAARLISDIENRTGAEREALADLFSSCGGAHLVGVTGPPGAGKSTLVGALIRAYRSRGATIGVIAVDPSSPFTGGALLGDRDRMVDSALDPDVFIRSIASRGQSGGLASAVNDAVDVMDAMGKDVVIIETVGVGQGELAIAKIAHTVLLTLVPGYGDALQAMKAGIIEIADVIAVNKSDMPGSQQVVQELHAQGLEHVSDDGSAVWTVPVTAVSARRGEGIDELVDSIAAHRAFTDAHGWTEVREHLRRQQQLRDLIHRHIEDEVMADLTSTATFERWSRRLDAGEVDPAGAARAVVGELRRHIALLEQGSDPGREATDPETAFSPQRQHHTRHEPESEVPSR